jgi:hypothetical protein
VGVLQDRKKGKERKKKRAYFAFAGLSGFFLGSGALIWREGIAGHVCMILVYIHRRLTYYPSITCV